jgi:hypothetical protein
MSFGNKGHASDLSKIIVQEVVSIGYKKGPWVSYIEDAFQASPPVYGVQWYADLFVEMCANESWLASFILKSAVEEGEGVRRLSEITRSLSKPLDNYKPNLERHAADELNHSNIFFDLFHECFPDSSYFNELKDQTLELANERVPESDVKEIDEKDLVKEFVQINLGEVKNYIHVRLLELVLRVKYEGNDTICSICKKLIKDELFHIKYTAEKIDKLSFLGNNEEIGELYLSAAEIFNDETLKDLREELDPIEAKETYSLT